MVSSSSLRIFGVLQELNRRRTIPASYWGTLEERLVMTFKPLEGRLKRSKTPRSKEEYKLQFKEKKAQKVYLEILEDYPHIFIPFILAIQPKACESFDLGEFRQKHDLTDRIDLRNDVRPILDGIAKKGGFNQNPLYQLLIGSLFPQVSGRIRMQKPITSAETINYWAYHAADLNAIRNIFGECICRTIEKSPRRIREAKCQTLQTTECVGMKLPRQNYQDAIILLEVCVAEDLIKTLFPSACERVLSLASVYSSEDCAQKNMPVVITPEHQKDLSSEYAQSEDSAFYIFQEASVSAIPSIFGPRIGDAIEKSQLREWEKDNSSQDTTDCVSMEIHRQQPHHGTFRLRIGFVAGTYIANKLYA